MFGGKKAYAAPAAPTKTQTQTRSRTRAGTGMMGAPAPKAPAKSMAPAMKQMGNASMAMTRGMHKGTKK